MSTVLRMRWCFVAIETTRILIDFSRGQRTAEKDDCFQTLIRLTSDTVVVVALTDWIRHEGIKGANPRG